MGVQPFTFCSKIAKHSLQSVLVFLLIYISLHICSTDTLLALRGHLCPGILHLHMAFAFWIPLLSCCIRIHTPRRLEHLLLFFIRYSKCFSGGATVHYRSGHIKYVKEVVNRQYKISCALRLLRHGMFTIWSLVQHCLSCPYSNLDRVGKQLGNQTHILPTRTLLARAQCGIFYPYSRYLCPKSGFSIVSAYEAYQQRQILDPRPSYQNTAGRQLPSFVSTATGINPQRSKLPTIECSRSSVGFVSKL